MSLYGWFVVILVTSAAVLLGVGWLMEHADRQYERVRLLAELDQATANVQLPRAGCLPHQGAQDPAYQLAPIPWDLAQQWRSPAPIPWDLVGAAYQLGHHRALQDDVSREVDAMVAEYDAQHGGEG